MGELERYGLLSIMSIIVLCLVLTFVGRGIDEVAEEVSGLGPLVAVAELGTEQAIEAAAHERQLEVTVDFHRDG